MKPDRKLLLLTSVYGSVGGIEKFNQLWISALVSQFPNGDWIVLSQLDKNEKINFPNKAMKFVGCNGAKQRFLGKLKIICKSIFYQFNPKVKETIVGHLQLGWPLYLSSVITRKQYTVLVYGFELTYRPSLLKKLILNRAKQILVISRNTQKLCAETYQVSEAKFKLFFPVADEAIFIPGEVEP